MTRLMPPRRRPGRSSALAPLLALPMLLVPLRVADAQPPVELAVVPSASAGASSAAELTLSAEVALAWDVAPGARVVVRGQDLQHQLDGEALPSSHRLAFELEPGCSVVTAEIGPYGPPEAVPSYRWQKWLLCRDGGTEARRSTASLVTAKTGDPLELRPLLAPWQVKAGSDLPVRIYDGGEARPGAHLEARDGQGDPVTAIAGAAGIAYLRIPREGQWTITYRPLDKVGGPVREAVLVLDLGLETEPSTAPTEVPR